MSKKIIAPVIAIVRDENYVESACHVEYCQTGEDEFRTSFRNPCQLFCVVLADKSVNYVLAESEQGAIGQSSCRRETPAQTWESQRALEIGATAIRLPMKIRGWGSQVF